MTLVKIHVIAVITAIVLIATTTMTGILSVSTVFATPLTFGPPEQVGNDTTTDVTTTTTTPPVGQQQQTIHITKHGTNSYVISDGSSSVGSFDTTYRVVGERSAIRASEDLITSTIVIDFSTSITRGYVMVGNTTTTTAGGAADGATLPNPFATPEQITERITSDFSRVIGEAENNTSQGQYVEIKCEFGMTLEDMRCHYIPLVGGGAGTLLTTAPTNTTAPTTPLEGE
jgi:hypothetical protein